MSSVACEQSHDFDRAKPTPFPYRYFPPRCHVPLPIWSLCVKCYYVEFVNGDFPLGPKSILINLIQIQTNLALAAAVIRIHRRIFTRRKFTADAVRRQIFRRRKFHGAVRRCTDKLNRVCFLFTTISLSRFPTDALNTSFEVNC